MTLSTFLRVLGSTAAMEGDLTFDCEKYTKTLSVQSKREGREEMNASVSDGSDSCHRKVLQREKEKHAKHEGGLVANDIYQNDGTWRLHKTETGTK